MSKSIRTISLEDIDRYQKDGLISFEGKPHNFCICLVDIVKSTNKISKIYKDSIKLRNYYSLFLNTMGKIIINYHGNILKNNGDSIIFYFPKTTDISPDNKSSFIDAIECGLTMASARCIINRKAHEEKIPPIYYRISTVYGKVETAKSLFINSNDSNVKTIDLFGHVMNLCAKINNIAPDNCMVIGEDFYNIILSITSKDELSSEYVFQEIGKYHIEPNQDNYKIYCVLSRYNRVITKNKDSNAIKSLEGDKKDSSDISKQYRILLVDDDVDILFTYKLALDSENYNVDAFSDPLIALKSFAE